MGFLTDFQQWVDKRWGGVIPLDRNWQIASMGLPGEVGEALEHLKKHLRDGKYPQDDLKLELGDVLHYLTVIARSYGWSLKDLMEANMEKLIERDKRRKSA